MSRAGKVNNKKARKDAYWARLNTLLDEYHSILIVTADNVGSNQMQHIRRGLRGKAVLLMGKNTMIRKAMRSRLHKNPELEALIPHVRGNVGFVFTNGELPEIRTKITELRVEASAKAGSYAPVDVIIPAGSTNMEPTKTSFFQALSIPTRITRATIEIINDVHLLVPGQRVNLSQAALLQMLGIRPFSYGLKVTTVYDQGSCYPISVMDWTDDDILQKFFRCLSHVTALSVAVGYPTVLSVPHTVLHGYRNLIALAVQADYSFPRADKVKQALSNPTAFAKQIEATTPVAPVVAKPPPPAASDTSREGGDDDDGGDADVGDLFGGGGDDDDEDY